MHVDMRVEMNGCEHQCVESFIEYLCGKSFFHMHMFFLPPVSFHLLCLCCFQFGQISVLIILRERNTGVCTLNCPTDTEEA